MSAILGMMFDMKYHDMYPEFVQESDLIYKAAQSATKKVGLEDADTRQNGVQKLVHEVDHLIMNSGFNIKNHHLNEYSPQEGMFEEIWMHHLRNKHLHFKSREMITLVIVTIHGDLFFKDCNNIHEAIDNLEKANFSSFERNKLKKSIVWHLRESFKKK